MCVERWGERNTENKEMVGELSFALFTDYLDCLVILNYKPLNYSLLLTLLIILPQDDIQSI